MLSSSESSDSDQIRIMALETKCDRLERENRLLRQQLAVPSNVYDTFLDVWRLKLSSPVSVDVLEQALAEFCELIDVDFGNLHVHDFSARKYFTRLSYPKQANRELNAGGTDYEGHPLLIKLLLKSGEFSFSSIEELPDDVVIDIDRFNQVVVNSAAVSPVLQEGRILAHLGVATVGRTKHWSDNELKLLRQFTHLLYDVLVQSQWAADRHDFDQQLLKNILKVTNIGYWVWEKGESVIRLNDGSDVPPRIIDSFDLMLATVVPEDRENIALAFEQCLSHGTSYEGVVSSIDEQGVRRSYKTYLCALAVDVWGGATRILNAYNDITGYVEQNKKLERATLKAEEANKAKSEFLARMSHEIRTPMNAVLGMAHLLSQTLLTEEQKDYLKAISISANDLLRIINDILDFSKIGANRLSIESSKFEIEALLDKVRLIIENTLADKPVNLVFDIEEKIPRQLVGDADRLKQVLVNLLHNAAKFTDLGNVVLQVRKMNEIGGKNLICFDVIDTGIGLDEQDLRQLFHPFSQVDASITRKYGGTGLGLAISSSLVEMMGGELTVKSQKGVGTTFSFVLPFERACSSASSSHKSASNEHDLSVGINPDFRKALQGLRILLVEDNVINQKVALGMLQYLGAEVDIVNNGQECLERLAAVEPSYYRLILMDIEMPVMDGISATTAIRENPVWNNIPILAMTAHAIEGDEERFTRSGVNGYISKPVSPKILYETLREYARS